MFPIEILGLGTQSQKNLAMSPGLRAVEGPRHLQVGRRQRRGWAELAVGGQPGSLRMQVQRDEESCGVFLLAAVGVLGLHHCKQQQLSPLAPIGSTPRVPTRMSCSPRRCLRSSGPTWPMWCCFSSHWGCRTYCSFTSWTHRLRTTCSTPCTSSGSWVPWTTQVWGVGDPNTQPLPSLSSSPCHCMQ